MADQSVYRITFKNGSVRHYGRRGVASAVSNPFRDLEIAKVERMPPRGWIDVTAEFVKESE